MIKLTTEKIKKLLNELSEESSGEEECLCRQWQKVGIENFLKILQVNMLEEHIYFSEEDLFAYLSTLMESWGRSEMKEPGSGESFTENARGLEALLKLEESQEFLEYVQAAIERMEESVN